MFLCVGYHLATCGRWTFRQCLFTCATCYHPQCHTRYTRAEQPPGGVLPRNVLARQAATAPLPPHPTPPYRLPARLPTCPDVRAGGQPFVVTHRCRMHPSPVRRLVWTVPVPSGLGRCRLPNAFAATATYRTHAHTHHTPLPTRHHARVFLQTFAYRSALASTYRAFC